MHAPVLSPEAQKAADKAFVDNTIKTLTPLLEELKEDAWRFEAPRHTLR